MDKIKTFFINFWNADTQVKLRIIATVIAAINLVLYIIGKDQLNIDADRVWGIITMIYTSVVSIRAMWKNNSITPEAILGDQVMRAEKNSVYEEVEEDEYITEEE